MSAVIARSPFTIRVVRRPEALEVLATIEPPPYARERPARIVDLADGEYRADRKTLLLVDDEAEMLHFLIEGLGDRYNLYLANDGSTALARLSDIPEPDLIISDVMMAGLDGHGFLAALRESALNELITKARELDMDEVRASIAKSEKAKHGA